MLSLIAPFNSNFEPYDESLKLANQQATILNNLEALVKKIEAHLEDLDNDSKETIEIELFGLQIYIDVATRGWDYRSIELIAVDIMNDECDALNEASTALFNALTISIQKMNTKTFNFNENKI